MSLIADLKRIRAEMRAQSAQPSDPWRAVGTSRRSNNDCVLMRLVVFWINLFGGFTNRRPASALRERAERSATTASSADRGSSYGFWVLIHVNR
jgi:hypothetical protein